jgi:hypothetical protein
MSRAQAGDVITQAGDEDKSYNQNATTSFNTAQGDVDTYGKAVGSFQAANPYIQGGAAQTAENQQITDTSAGQAQRLGQALQGSAVRGGQNPGAAIAAGKEITAENTRAAMGAEAGATEARLGAGTTYAEAGLKGLGEQATMQDKMAEEQGQLAQGALSTQEKSADSTMNGTFMDNLALAAGKPPQSV